jgi:beta-N-acetylhexosaminidase
MVLRFASPFSIAAGPVPWGMATALRQRGVRVTAVDVDVDAAAHHLDRLTGMGRRLVLAVRDLHRQAGQAAAVESIVRRSPGAVLVEMGLPLCRPASVRNYVATYGSARVCAEAAAAAMVAS